MNADKHADDLQRWLALWQRLNARSAPRLVFAELAHAYQQLPRAYHTLDHIHVCLMEFDAARHLAKQPDEVELALWCHDVIYDPHAADNEMQSAAWTTRVLREAAVAEDRITRIADLIVATQHQTPPDRPDAALTVDIDLAGLGRSAAEFDRYDAAIRQEYQWVPDAEYRIGRLEVLERFMARSTIYHTAFFQARYETPARLNLRRALQRLRIDG